MSNEEILQKIRHKKIIYSVLLILVSGIGLGFLFLAGNYQTEFSQGTKINGIDVSGMTVEEAENKIRKEAKEYQITLKFRENHTETIQGKDVDYEYVNSYNVQEILDEQNGIQWFWKRAHQEYELEANYSTEKLKEVVGNFPELDKEKMVSPQDAGPAYENGTFYIKEEVPGTKMKKKSAVRFVGDALKNGETSVDMDTVYEEPKVLSDDESLNSQVDNLNDLVGVSITYKLPDGSKEVLDGTELLTWLVKDKNGIYKKKKSVWDKKMKEYVSELAKKVNTVSKPRPFKTTGGKVIQLKPSPYYGWQVAEELELEKLAKELKKKKDVERRPVYARVESADPDDNDGFGKTYCEVNLAKQHLWIYVKGKKKLETDVVSGKDDPKHKTPAGAFTAYDKRQNKILRGDRQPNGRYEYETKVNYWIRLTPTGVGLHDAGWRPKFGGNIWRAGGSHGCINLPATAAAQIYQLLSNGDPIIVYY
ncbi:MAG: L,D-transpeptidase family protein [Eubacterium sp.]|nr:L,D-transpeptidase family protein [Eubacterium sp.]